MGFLWDFNRAFCLALSPAIVEMYSDSDKQKNDGRGGNGKTENFD